MTERLKDEIREKYKQPINTLRKLANEYEVSTSAIHRIVGVKNPRLRRKESKKDVGQINYFFRVEYANMINQLSEKHHLTPKVIIRILCNEMNRTVKKQSNKK